MKTQLKRYVALVTRLPANEFTRARLVLCGVYLLALLLITIPFALYLQYQVVTQLHEALVGSASIHSEDATSAARAVKQGQVSDVALEARFDRIVYAVEFTDADGLETDVFVDAHTGAVLGVFPDGADAPESWSEGFINEIAETILLTCLVILLVFGVFGYWFAGYTLRPIEKKMRQHEQFSADVAHELRTPLAAVSVALAAALRIGTEVAYRESITRSKQEIDRLITLTEQLLKTNRQSVAHVPIALSELLHRVVHSIEPLATEKNVRLEVTTAPCDIIGNTTELEELVFNILHNAIKFSKPDTCIEIVLTASGTLRVTDYGVGIAAAVLPHVFDRFYTASSARAKNDGGGFGLGLAIAKRIAHAHGATIVLESVEGQGTTMTVQFPLH